MILFDKLHKIVLCNVHKGWLGAPTTKKRLRKVQKLEARNAREPCGVGYRNPFKGPGGVQGQNPWWIQGG